MYQRIAELSSLVDRARSRDTHVARDTARRGELAHEPEQTRCVQRYRRVDLRVRALEIHVGDDGRPTMARPGDVEHVAVALLDEPVELHVDQALRRRRAPVAEQARFDVLDGEPLAEERVCLEIDL